MSYLNEFLRQERAHEMRRSTKLREMMKSGKTIVIPGCYNAVSGKILDKIGFPAIYMTGYGTSLSLTGMPDCGLATMTEMHLNARYISNAVSVPVIADADNGFPANLDPKVAYQFAQFFQKGFGFFPFVLSPDDRYEKGPFD